MKKILLVATLLLCIGLIPALAASAQSPEAANNITVETIQSQSLAEKIIANVAESWPWYASRASGIVAGITLIVLMLSGIGQITGTTFKVLEPIKAWASHRALGIVFIISVLIHVISLLFDKFFSITIPEILIPWLSKYKPVEIFGIQLGSLFLAFGILAFYISIAIVITSLTIMSKKAHFWKIMHLLSYIVIALVFFHALYLGTDFAHGWTRIMLIVSGLSVLIAAIYRLRRVFTT